MKSEFLVYRQFIDDVILYFIVKEKVIVFVYTFHFDFMIIYKIKDHFNLDENGHSAIMRDKKNNENKLTFY